MVIYGDVNPGSVGNGTLDASYHAHAVGGEACADFVVHLRSERTHLDLQFDGCDVLGAVREFYADGCGRVSSRIPNCVGVIEHVAHVISGQWPHELRVGPRCQGLDFAFSFSVSSAVICHLSWGDG